MPPILIVVAIVLSVVLLSLLALACMRIGEMGERGRCLRLCDAPLSVYGSHSRSVYWVREAIENRRKELLPREQFFGKEPPAVKPPVDWGAVLRSALDDAGHDGSHEHGCEICARVAQYDKAEETNVQYG
jgi:hypothetical protein